MKHLAEVESPTDLTGPSRRFIARKTWREFGRDQCADLAAALTYYAILALFPAAIALLALLGLFDQGPKAVETMTQVLDDLGASSAADTLRPTLDQLAAASTAAPIAFIAGIAVALWGASGYVGSFGRAMNRIYGVEEGRPVWKLRPVQLVVTLVLVVLAAVVLMGLVLTGPAAAAVGDQLGLGDTAVLAWDIAKWPVLLVAVMLMVAILYYATPNVRQPRFRWLSIGAVVAILVWVLASAAFGFYVANFSSYNKTYGSLAGVIAFLLWLWITNVALLFGAELDSELERGRELQSGLAAERSIQLPLRDKRGVDKAEAKLEKEVAAARELRAAADVPDQRKESTHVS